MKKKKPLIVICCAVALIAIGAFVLLKNNINIELGSCVMADDGTHLIVVDNEPVMMYRTSGDDNIFENLQTGNRILIVNNGIGGIPPIQKTGVYFLVNFGGNTNVSEEVINALIEEGLLTDTDTIAKS